MNKTGKRGNGFESRSLQSLYRLPLAVLVAAGLALTLAGCTNALVDSISVTPTTQSLTAGQTSQFTATAVTDHSNGHPATSQDVTDTVTWASSSPAVATVNSTGLCTGVSAGTATITATMPGFTGNVTSSATVTVTASGGTGSSGGAFSSLTIIPGSQSVATPNQATQFFAIGTTSSGATVNATNQVAWYSSDAQVATVNSNGVATGVGQGSTTITAIATNADNTVATGTATLSVSTGAAEQITALQILPGSQAATAQTQQSQFFVLGTAGNSGLQYDWTSQVTWSSSNQAVATIGTTGNGTPGLATAVGSGSTTITATWKNADGSVVVATAGYSVTIGAPQEPLLSISVVPAGITVWNKGQTGQYLALGTYSTTPTMRDLTNSVTWISLLPEVASINSGGTAGEQAGLATAQGYTGSSVIYAEASNPDGTVVLSNPQTFTCLDPTTNVCDQTVAHPQFATITVFIEGENTTPTGEYVTAPSDTGTPDLIHCGPDWTGSGGQVCTGTYETGSTVVLTENLPSGSSYFGGWSSGDGASGVGCTPANGFTLINSTTCTVTLTGNTSVGAIFY